MDQGVVLRALPGTEAMGSEDIKGSETLGCSGLECYPKPSSP